MKTKLFLASILTAVAIGASATQVTGGIGFSGAYSASSFDLSTPGLVLSFPDPVIVNTRSGYFATVPVGSLVTMISSLTVNPAVLPGTTLWSVGGFSFTLTSFAEKDVSPTSLVLYGSVLSGNDYSNTSGEWIATFNSLGEGTFTFSSSTAAIPDGGVTVMLLGSALSGMAMLRKKLQA